MCLPSGLTSIDGGIDTAGAAWSRPDPPPELGGVDSGGLGGSGGLAGGCGGGATAVAIIATGLLRPLPPDRSCEESPASSSDAFPITITWPCADRGRLVELPPDEMSGFGEVVPLCVGLPRRVDSGVSPAASVGGIGSSTVSTKDGSSSACFTRAVGDGGVTNCAGGGVSSRG